jgi:hypothetical protein
VLTAHHIACDGWSFDIVLRELAAQYTAAENLPPAMQFADYVQWERQQDARRRG